MHPILFKIPLPSFNLRIAWIPFIIAALAAIYAATRMIGKEKDRQGALIGLGVAAAAIIARFTLLAGNTDSWNLERLPIYSYGVMLGLSLVVGWYLTLGLAERDGLPKETMANNYVVTAIAAVAGSRILYILTNLNEFDTVASIFAMRKGGLVAYGGFLGGLAGSYFFLRRHKIPLLPWADVAVPSLASGLMITRIGCYLFGCDFGQPLSANAPELLKKLGTFPHWPEGKVDAGSGSPAWAQHVKEGLIASTADASLPVHPTQIYESLVGLALLVLLLWARKKQKFRGQIFFLFAFAYGVARYMLEILRDDAERGSIPPELSKHILIPVGIAILAAGYVIGFSKQIENKTVRLVSQIAAFLPAVALYFAMVPAAFGQEKPYQFSTSQFIAITTGFAACLAFSVFYKAALAHPKYAMDLGLPRQFLPEGAAPPEPEAAEDDEEEERVKKPVKRAKTSGAKTGPSAKGKVKAKAKPKPVEEDADSDEEDRAPAKAEKKDAKKSEEKPAEDEPTGRAKEDEDDPKDEADGEPVKAS